MTASTHDPSVMESDCVVLHERIGRLIHLARGKGATEDELRAAVRGPLHPEDVNLPSAGRFPAIDPTPYLDMVGDRSRMWNRLPRPEDAGKLCGAQITEEGSVQLRESPSDWDGITTCILPVDHAPSMGRQWHQGILIRNGSDYSFPTIWQWEGALRELGQVTPR